VRSTQAGGVADPALASTGSDLGIAGIVAAMALLLTGGVLMVLRHRRRSASVDE
jgi:LPXTG-motif cell wall-anchored protein